MTVNKEHWSQYFFALNWCNRTSTTGCSVGGYLTKFLMEMLRLEVQHLTLLYRKNSRGFSLQRHLGLNGVCTTRNVGRLILIFQTGTNTTHQTSRAVLAVHKTSVSGIGEVISHLPLSPSLFPHPSPPPPHTHTLDPATQGKWSDYDWNFKLSRHVKSRPRRKWSSRWV